jgi:hypothetical protein
VLGGGVFIQRLVLAKHEAPPAPPLDRSITTHDQAFPRPQLLDTLERTPRCRNVLEAEVVVERVEIWRTPQRGMRQERLEL